MANDAIELQPAIGDDATRRRVPLLGPALVLVLVVGAVAFSVVARGADDTNLDAEGLSYSGVAATTLAETARVSLRVASDGGEAYEGVISFADEQAEFYGSQIDGDQEASIRSVGEITFVGVPLDDEDRVTWLSFSAAEYAEQFGGSLAPGTSPLLGIIRALVRSLDFADEATIVEVGRDTERGVDVTVSRATVDPRVLLESVFQVTDDASFDTLLGQFGTDVEVAIDAESRVRRVSLTTDEGTIAVHLWDFGVAVDVEIPDGAVSFAEFNSGARQGAIDNLAEIDPNFRYDIDQSEDPFCVQLRRTPTRPNFADALAGEKSFAYVLEKRRQYVPPAELADLTQQLTDYYGMAVDRIDEGESLEALAFTNTPLFGDASWSDVVVLEGKARQLEQAYCNVSG